MAEFSAILQNESVQRRFWEKVHKRGPDECWEWKTRSGRRDYGCFSINGKPQRAHRVSWIMHFGEIPEGLFVCHSCDNPPCINPRHLWLGTAQDNVVDMVRKGRGYSPISQGVKIRKAKGEAHGSAKLNNEKVLEIRRRLNAGERDERLGLEFGVGRTAIRYIRTGRRWNHI